MPSPLHYKKNIYTKFFNVAPGVWGMSNWFTNIFMILNPFDGNWVLVDTGYKCTAPKIKKMASQIFGAGNKPSAIILTHAHHDHSGGLQQLQEDWNVPVYVHENELCFLTENESYPPPDLSLSGGIFSMTPKLFPHTGKGLKQIEKLPENGIPGLPQWEYIHTPGHSPGHICLYREADGVLLSGDAACTLNRHSFYSFLFEKNKIFGPSKFYTYNWHEAKISVKKLAQLRPGIIASSHGKPLHGEVVKNELYKLVRKFSRTAVPRSGVYTTNAAVIDKRGIVFVPRQQTSSKKIIMKLLSILAAAGIFMAWKTKRKQHQKLQQALAYEIW